MEELCRDLGCSTAFFYLWKKRYGDASVAVARRLKRLERENDRLLRILGQQRLETLGMREVLAKKRERLLGAEKPRNL